MRHSLLHKTLRSRVCVRNYAEVVCYDNERWSFRLFAFPFWKIDYEDWIPVVSACYSVSETHAFLRVPHRIGALLGSLHQPSGHLLWKWCNEDDLLEYSPALLIPFESPHFLSYCNRMLHVGLFFTIKFIAKRHVMCFVWPQGSGFPTVWTPSIDKLPFLTFQRSFYL